MTRTMRPAIKDPINRVDYVQPAGAAGWLAKKLPRQSENVLIQCSGVHMAMRLRFLAVA